MKLVVSLTLLLLLPALACSLLLPLPGDEGRPCESGGCKPGYRCVSNICKSVQPGPRGYDSIGHWGTLRTPSPFAEGSYAIVDDGFEFTEVACNDTLCVVGGIIQ